MYRLFASTVLLLLCACTGGDEAASSGARPEKGGRHVWSTMTDQIDRSRGVEDTLMESQVRERRQIEEQTR
jgi:hypothetical protein